MGRLVAAVFLFGTVAVQAADQRQLACVKRQLSAGDRHNVAASADRWADGAFTDDSAAKRALDVAARTCGIHYRWSEKARRDAAYIVLTRFDIGALRRRAEMSRVNLEAVDATFAAFSKADRYTIISDPQPSPTPIEKGLKTHGIVFGEGDRRFLIVNDLLYNRVSLATAEAAFATD